MRADTALQEDVKDVSSAKGRDKIPNIDLTMPELKLAMQASIQEPPSPWLPIVPEWVLLGNSHFQNLLAAILLSQYKPTSNVSRLAIRPRHEDLTKDITRDWETTLRKELPHILEEFKAHRKDFVGLYYAPIKSIFPHLDLGETSLGQPASSSAPSAPSTTDGLPLVKYIKEVASIAHVECSAFARRIAAGLADPKKSEYYQTLKEYHKYWSKYVLGALEIDLALFPLNASMKELASSLLAHKRKKVPEFSVWRLMVGMFRAVVYLPNRTALLGGLMAQLKNLGMYLLWRTTHPTVPKAAPKDTLKWLRSESDHEPREEDRVPPMENFREERNEAYYLYQSLLDMDLNESSVHFLFSKDLPSNLCRDIASLLSELIKKLVGEFPNKENQFDIFQAWLNEVNTLLKEIFPPRLWDEINQSCSKYACEVREAKIRTYVDEFSKLPKDRQEKYATGVAVSTEYHHITKVLPKYKDAQGKTIIRAESYKRFFGFLSQHDSTLSKTYTMLCTNYDKAREHRKRIEDDDIEFKNNSFGISILPEDLAFFPLCGVNEPQLSELASL